MAQRKTKGTEDLLEQTREIAEASLVSFIKLVFPKQVLGSVHIELCEWLTRQGRKSHQLVLLPRDHGKSRIVAFYALWRLTKDPPLRILYISSTSSLAEKQLGFIKDIMETKIYQRYWPSMISPEEGRRKKWTNTEIAVDHPSRVAEGIRDPSIMTAGLNTSITGLHFDLSILDDVVVRENATSDEGRAKVASQYSLLASIEGADSDQIAVGTRYHPNDLYYDMSKMEYEIYDTEGNVLDTEFVYEIFERQVEAVGDGTGEFLWPRQQRSDGKWFGFDAQILSRKRATYLDRTQYYAQYYNNPNYNEHGDEIVFQYYDRELLKRDGGNWSINGKRLNVICSADFGYTLGKRRDYTAIAVVGIDSDRNHYVLDLDRFKTDQIKVYYDHIVALYSKWDFKKLVAEAVSAAHVIVQELKNSYLKPNGIMISVDMVKPTSHGGSKDERVWAILSPRYDNNSMYHYRGGNCQVLEDELRVRNPPHDDCRDALAIALEHIVPPSSNSAHDRKVSNISSHPRFGGFAG